MIAVEAPPCADCGTTGGRIQLNCVAPARTSGLPFGFDGDLCHRCYARNYKRHKAAGKKMPTKPSRDAGEKVDPLDHQRLLCSIAMRYLGRGLCAEDLIAEGQIGLLIACEKFEPERQLQFSTYAVHWIRKTISKALREQVSLLRIPGFVREEMRLESPTESQKERIRAAELAMRRPVGDAEPGELSFMDILCDHREKGLARLFDAHEIAYLSRDLTKRETEVVRLRYGLGGDAPMTFAEVAKELGVTWQRVQQIEATALAKMRKRAAYQQQRVAS